MTDTNDNAVMMDDRSMDASIARFKELQGEVKEATKAFHADILRGLVTKAIERPTVENIGRMLKFARSSRLARKGELI